MKDLSEIFSKHKKDIVDFIDGVRKEAYNKGKEDGKAESIDEYNEALKECLLSIGDIDSEDIDYLARKLKEKNK